MSLKRLKKSLALPEAELIRDLDASSTSLRHAEIIQKKPFLKKLYADFYGQFLASIVNHETKRIVEIGSGGGFIKTIAPGVKTSDVTSLPGLDYQFSAARMPFENESIDAFLLLNTFHHIGETGAFLAEVNRCLRSNGRLIMIEPANTRWSRFVYRRFHHEPFNPDVPWDRPAGGRMTSANSAIPWIVFVRDRQKFEALFPKLRIRTLRPHTPFRYLISGGVSYRQIFPSWTYPLVLLAERISAPFNRYLGMFMTIVLEKTA